ncbi:MAG: mechanosensitive ion channel family protein [Leptolyngbyaceae cyanobacterium SM2_3_12]|nr:mechanosensitive ion channel family protein [Leptolyngbyaceae cyanobacterium SM2_3_12]
MPPLPIATEPRLILRSSTLEGVFSGIINVAAVSIGLLWLLLIQNIDLSALLTGAGIFGAALGLIFQNLIRDWLNGVLIIFEDQYAVGDVISIDGTTGFVEAMSIRATQIRSDGGRLSTIPHNLVGVVHNLTKDWARIDFTITIANQANPVEAMALMQQTIRAMGHDPAWHEDILDPVVLIGVNNVSATGTELLMWIQTRRMRQWDVEREYRRRLKQRFEEEGIAIGVPEQKLQLAPMSSGPWVEPSEKLKA